MSKIEFTTLYRAFNKNNELLYVGISGSLMTRMNSHKRTKSWFKEISCLTTKHYDTREEALTAESKAIKEENPKYNIQGKQDKPRNKPHRSSKINSHDAEVISFFGFDHFNRCSERHGIRDALKLMKASMERGGPAPTGTSFTMNFPPNFQPSSSSSLPSSHSS